MPEAIMIKKIKRTREGSAQHAPRIVGEILHDYLENSNEPLAVAYREHTTESEKQGWNPNTHLGCDLKTLLRSDECMRIGKAYQGVLRLDANAEIGPPARRSGGPYGHRMLLCRSAAIAVFSQGRGWKNLSS